MATELTLQQKQEIYSRVNNGETGSALAKEFGVSNSTVSNIKNNSAFAVTATKAKASVKATTKTKVALESKKAVETTTAKISTPAKTRTVIITSLKHANVEFQVPVNATLGDLLTIAGEEKAVEAIFRSAKSGEKKRLQSSTDKLPGDPTEVLTLCLVPIKVDSGI